MGSPLQTPTHFIKTIKHKNYQSGPTTFRVVGPLISNKCPKIIIKF